MTVLSDERFLFEGAFGVHAVRSAVLAWPGVGAVWADASFPSTPLLRTELVVTDHRGRRQAALAVEFDKRVQRDGLTSLLGHSRDGSLQVSLDTSIPMSGVRMNFRFDPGPESTPEALNEVVSWFGALREERQLGLWMRDRGRWGIVPEQIPPDHPHLPDDYALAVRVLARIQQRSGRSFAMPEVISEVDAEAIGVADALVRGETVAGSWADLSVNEDVQLLALLQESPHGALLEFKAAYCLRLGDQEIPIGIVDYRFLQVEHSKHDKEHRVIRLKPGSRTNRFEVRLVGVAGGPRADGATSWVPKAVLEPFAGRWVAQSGTLIVRSSDSFVDLVQGLRASGRLATIWRVPESTEEAEAHHVVGR